MLAKGEISQSQYDALQRDLDEIIDDLGEYVRYNERDKFGFVERFPELSLFYRLSSPLDSEMICIFPCFCPCEESAREIREILFRHCSLLYQEVLRNPALLFLLSERKYSLWY